MFEIPVSADAAQQFITQLGDAKYVFDLQWNDRSQQFSLTLSNDDTGQVYFEGHPVVLGTDILEPYNYGIGSMLAVDTSNTGREATLTDFGDRVKLYWFSEEEKANAISASV
jgi:hypothetical protein